MTTSQLYDTMENYINSRMWESDLAKNLGLSIEDVSKLCGKYGAYRHKITKKVTKEEFIGDPTVLYICGKIK